jgi:serine/threonine-protein kinase HipA
MLGLAETIVRQHMTVTGVQPKLSLVPEVEDATMHLAELACIVTVPHGLLWLQDGALAYVTRRIDRSKGQKLHMEAMCQLTERLTENKYDGSHEQIAKALRTYSVNPGLDVVNFYELVLFSFLSGNADMHLKNFSLLHTSGLGYGLAPAYDLVATALVNPADTEELALTLNGKKKKLQQADFLAAARQAGVEDKVMTGLFIKFTRVRSAWEKMLAESFLPAELKDSYWALL